jgi:hypothetical protein
MGDRRGQTAKVQGIARRADRVTACSDPYEPNTDPLPDGAFVRVGGTAGVGFCEEASLVLLPQAAPIAKNHGGVSPIERSTYDCLRENTVIDERCPLDDDRSTRAGSILHGVRGDSKVKVGAVWLEKPSSDLIHHIGFGLAQ